MKNNTINHDDERLDHDKLDVNVLKSPIKSIDLFVNGEKHELNDDGEEEEKDPMSIEINSGRWISFIPGLTLTSATILFAFLGLMTGLIIAFTVNDPSITEQHIFTAMKSSNISLESAEEGNLTINSIEQMHVINGEQILIYYKTNITNITLTQTDGLSDDWYAIIEFPGKLWLSALKLLVLPLIILMMMILPSRVDKIGEVGKRAIPLYLFTSLCASIVGTIIAWTVEPGSIGGEIVLSSTNDINVPDAKLSITEVILNVFYGAIPENIITAMANFEMLGIIVFFLCIGLLLSNKNIVPVRERDIVLSFNKALLRCVMKGLVVIIWFSPFGMFSLICVNIAATDDLLNLLISLGFYLLCVICALFIHIFIFFPTFLYVTTRRNGYKLLADIYQAPLLAFATSSSAATLPRSLQMAKNAGIADKIYQFIIPLGSAINMDGSAATFPIQIALIAQLNGVPLDIGQIFIVMILSIVVSVGAAPIPNAGMIYVMMLFEAVGMDEYVAEAIGILFVVDWLVDRMGTAVNVTSDQFIAKIIHETHQRQNNEKIICGCCISCFAHAQNNKHNENDYDKVSMERKISI